mgnify:CR=1 FL=1
MEGGRSEGSASWLLKGEAWESLCVRENVREEEDAGREEEMEMEMETKMKMKMKQKEEEVLAMVVSLINIKHCLLYVSVCLFCSVLFCSV